MPRMLVVRAISVFLLAVVALAADSTAAHGQAKTTASRAGDLQIGGGYSSANSDYAPDRVSGGAFYTDFDFTSHFGVELGFHQLNDSKDSLYERTYEAGGRYFRNYGSLTPYVKALYGRGVLNFPQGIANIAYNIFAGGGGVDIAVKPWLNVRGDFEYQSWASGPGIVHGITPMVITVGAAYHFGHGKPVILR